MGSGAPSVGVVIATRDRPELVRRAVASAVAQEHDGDLEVVVVFDGTQPDTGLEVAGPRPVRVLANTRTPGLCGSRNTGVLALGTDLVAFLDDDDVWLPGKVAAQARRFASPEVEFSTTAIRVRSEGSTTVRRTGRDVVDLRELLVARTATLHSSGFAARRSALLSGLGLVDETIPGGMCEDWDLLIRAARRGDIAHVDEPLVEVLWGSTSFFADRWETKIAAHTWMLAHHPDLADDPRGAARLYGKLAFSHAALGRRRGALRWAGAALRRRPTEPRAHLALLVATGLVSSGRVLAQLQARGRGI